MSKKRQIKKGFEDQAELLRKGRKNFRGRKGTVILNSKKSKNQKYKFIDEE